MELANSHNCTVLIGVLVLEKEYSYALYERNLKK